MKSTRLIIPALSLAATTLLVAQGQPEPFPTPAPPATPVPPAPVPPAPVTPAPVTPPPAAVPVPPAPVTPAVPIPAVVPPAATPAIPATPAPATAAAPVQPVSDPSIGVGLVNGTRVSARGRATIFSSLVFQFNKNEPVNILEEINIAAPKAGEPRKWYRVQVPADAGLWVHSDFLEAANILNGVDAAGKPVKLNVSSVRATNLNVRGGAGEQFPVLAKMPRGSQLVLTGASKGKWMEVLAPQNASVFVAAQFVTRQQASVGVVEVPPVPAVTPTPTPVVPTPVTPAPPKPTGQNTPTVTLPIQELGQGNGQTPGGVEVKQNPSITNPKPVQPTEVAVNPKPEVATPAKPEVTTPAKPVQIAKVNPNLPAPTLTKPKADKPVRIVTREGIVRRTLDIQSPTGYVLEHLESGKKINYLVLDEQVALKLNWFVGKQVLVSGEEALDARNANTPVLLVNTLKGELTQEFISKIAAARKEAVEKAQQEAEEAKRKAEENKAKEEDSKPEESAPEQSEEDKPEAN